MRAKLYRLKEIPKTLMPLPSKTESSELERKKRDLFQDIENSNKYENSNIREQSLKRYKHIIKTKERTACHDDVILFIDKISNLHKK